MSTFPDCIPQTIYEPDFIEDNWLQDVLCPLCGKEEVHEIMSPDDEGFLDINYHCNDCDKDINPDYIGK